MAVPLADPPGLVRGVGVAKAVVAVGATGHAVVEVCRTAVVQAFLLADLGRVAAHACFMVS